MPQNSSIKLVLSNFLLASLIVPGSLLGEIQASFADDVDDIQSARDELIEERDALEDDIEDLVAQREELAVGGARDALTLAINIKKKMVFLLRIDIDKMILEISKLRRTNLEVVPGGDPFLSNLGDINNAISLLEEFKDEVEGTDIGSELSDLSKRYNLFRKTQWADLFGLVEVDRNIKGLNKLERIIERINQGIETKNINNEELDGLVAEAQAAWQAVKTEIENVKEALNVLAEADGKNDIKAAWQSAHRAIKALWEATRLAGRKTEEAYTLYNELLAGLATCVYPEWSSISWSNCSSACTQSRTKVATFGGDQCEDRTQSRACTGGRCNSSDPGDSGSGADDEDDTVVPPSVNQPSSGSRCVGSGCDTTRTSCKNDYDPEQYSPNEFGCVVRDEGVAPASLPCVGDNCSIDRRSCKNGYDEVRSPSGNRFKCVFPSVSGDLGETTDSADRTLKQGGAPAVSGDLGETTDGADRRLRQIVPTPCRKDQINAPFFGCINNPFYTGDTSGADRVLRQIVPVVPDCGDGRAILNTLTGQYSCSVEGALNRFAPTNVPSNAHPSSNSLGWKCNRGYGVNDSRTGCRLTPTTPARSTTPSPVRLIPRTGTPIAE